MDQTAVEFAGSRPADVQPSAGAVTGAVAVFLRVEGLLELALAIAVYRWIGDPQFEGSWTLFLLLFLLPDLTMLGYLANPRIGAHLYNLGHTFLMPALLALAGFALKTPLLYSLSLIWVAHVGFDRACGYGLKYPTAFGATHLSTRIPPGTGLRAAAARETP